MADSEELRRLVLHAAERLSEEKPNATLVKAIGQLGYSDQPPVIYASLRLVAAMALAEATLRMVAACMAIEDAADV